MELTVHHRKCAQEKGFATLQIRVFVNLVTIRHLARNMIAEVSIITILQFVADMALVQHQILVFVMLVLWVLPAILFYAMA